MNDCGDRYKGTESPQDLSFLMLFIQNFTLFFLASDVIKLTI